MKQKLCQECQCKLSKDEIALSKKMIGRETIVFYCLSCLAKELEVDREDLEIKIAEFKEQGCSLFS
jgi:hypothetical protein